MRAIRTTALAAALVLAASACGGPRATPGAAGPVVRVSAAYPGASAQVVADTVAAPIEAQVNGAEGIAVMESECRDDGGYTLTVRFAPGTDPDAARARVRARVDLATPTLPEVVRLHAITTDLAPDRPPAFWLAVTSPDGKHDAAYLATVARQRVCAVLAGAPGVAEVRVAGAGEPALRMWLDPNKLAARNLTAADAVRSLEEKSNVRVAAGRVGQGPRDGAFAFTLTTRGRLENPDDLGKLILVADKEGAVTRLRDVARIEAVAGEGEFAEAGGRPAALVAVTPEPGKLTATELRKAAAAIPDLPAGVKVELAADLSAGGVAVVDVRLPTAASKERTREVVAQVCRLVRALPGEPGCTAHGGDPEANAEVLVTLPARKPGTVERIRAALREVQAAHCRVSEVPAGGRPFPVRLAVTDPGDHGAAALHKAAEELARRLDEAGAIEDPAVSPGPAEPRLEVVFDRKKLRDLGVPAKDATEAIRTVAGGRLQDPGAADRDPVLRLDADRHAAADLGALKLRNGKGEMVPLQAVATIRDVVGETTIVRVNRHRAVVLTANPPKGTTPAAATDRCLKVADAALPGGFQAVGLTR